MRERARQLAHLESRGDAARFAGQIYLLIPKCPLLENFTPAEVNLLAHFMEVYRAADKMEIIHEGDGGDFMLILIQGRVEVRKRDRYKKLQLSSVDKAGHALGELWS